MEFVSAFVHEFITLFSEMAPFLLLGFLLAGIIHVWIPNALYVPKISKSNFASVLWAALFGVPLPICSCGVIPTSIAIRKEGASKGASVSFLISTPATGVDSILATYSLLGLPFAILRPVAAFATALFGGVLTNFVTRGEESHDGVAVLRGGTSNLKHEHHEHEHCECGDHGDCDGDDCGCGCSEHGCCCDNRDVHDASFIEKLKETFRYGLVNMVGDVSKWLMIGLVLGALISAFVPNELFLALREYPLLCMVCVLLLAMPMYTCATGSIPLALALVAKGITPGAALVLLMAGPATSIASMLVVGKAFGKRTLVAYLVSIAVGAIGFGFIVDTFFMDTFLSAMLPQGSAECHGHGALGVFDYVCAGLLAAFMIYAKFIHKGCDDHCGCGCGCGDSCKCADSHEDKHCDCGDGHGDECDDEHEHCHCNEHEHVHDAEHMEPSKNKLHVPKTIEKTYKVFGMNCSHCKACVEKAVRALDGIVFVVADVASKSLHVEYHDADDVDETALKTAIEEAGFEFGGEA